MPELPDPKDFKYAEGMLYTQYCRSCGESNGGRFLGPDVPKWDPAKRPQPCVWCRSEDTVWELVGYSDGGKVFPDEPGPPV